MHTSLFEDFTPTLREDWIDKIIVDLKGKNIDDLNREVHKRWNISAFLTKEDAPSSIQSLNLPKGWTIVEDFRRKSEIHPKEVLRSLEGGVQGLYLSTQQYQDLQSNPEIFWNMISVFMDVPEKEDIQIEAAHVWKTRTTLSGDQQHLSKFSIASNDPVEAISSWACQVVQQIDDIDESQLAAFLSKCWHSITIGPNYLLEIARLRAIRLVWNQIMQDYSLDQEAVLMAEIGPEVSQESAYQNMISFSIAALSAAIGGANMIMIQNLEDEQLSESTQSRIPRNMQHLLQLESHLDKVSDPAAGSYLLDTLTQKIASEAWAAFLEKVEQPSS